VVLPRPFEDLDHKIIRNMSHRLALLETELKDGPGSGHRSSSKSNLSETSQIHDVR